MKEVVVSSLRKSSSLSGLVHIKSNIKTVETTMVVKDDSSLGDIPLCDPEEHRTETSEKEAGKRSFFLKRVVDVVVEAPFIVTMVKRTEHIWGLV